MIILQYVKRIRTRSLQNGKNNNKKFKSFWQILTSVLQSAVAHDATTELQDNINHTKINTTYIINTYTGLLA